MSIERLIYIYTLSDPITKEIRYVGKTVQKPTSRLSSHISQSKYNSKTDYCHCWIKSLLNKNLNPIMNIIEETFNIERESYWINYYRNENNKLTNFTDGGDLGNLGKTWKVKKESLYKYKFKNNKPILQYTLQGSFIKEWVSGREFARFYNLNKSTVSVSLLKKTTCGGYIVILKGDVLDLTIYKFNKKPVFILDKINNIKYSFKSACEAANILKLNNSSISKCAKNKKLLHKQYKIRYYDFMP